VNTYFWLIFSGGWKILSRVLRKPDRWFKYILLIAILFWTLIPLWWLIRMSFMFSGELSAIPPHIIPEKPTLVNYMTVLGFTYTVDGTTYLPSGNAEQIRIGIMNSLLVGFSVTAITLAVAAPVSYAFGRLRFRHKNKMLFMLLSTRAIPPISILIPYFIVFQRFKLIGTIPGLIIITLSITIPFVTWALMGFFTTLPRDLERAARMDGYSKFGAFLKVVLPVAKPGLAVGAIISFLFSWNEYVFALFLSGGYEAQTLPPSALADPTALTLSLIPPFVVCFILQRYITDLHIADPFGK